MEKREVIVIGGGIIGLSAAYELAKAGRQVTVLEKEKLLGSGSTGLCAGGIRQQFTTDVNIALSRESVKEFERLGTELGCRFEFLQRGYLFFTHRPSQLEAMKVNAAIQQKNDIPVEVVGGDEIRRRWGYCTADDVIGGTFCPKDGYCDPHEAVQGYAAKIKELGGEILTRVPVTGIKVSGGRVVSVETPQGALGCAWLINAAGPYAGEVGKMAGLAVPVVPVRRHLFVTEPLEEIPEESPMTIDSATGLYFRKESRGLMIGLARQDEPAGFNFEVDWDWLEHMVNTAVARVPRLEEKGIVKSWSGMYEVTPDHHPILGPAPACPNFLLACGFSGHGFMHAPAVAKVVKEFITEGRARTVDVSCLGLSRFAEGKLVHERAVI